MEHKNYIVLTHKNSKPNILIIAETVRFLFNLSRAKSLALRFLAVLMLKPTELGSQSNICFKTLTTRANGYSIIHYSLTTAFCLCVSVYAPNNYQAHSYTY